MPLIDKFKNNAGDVAKKVSEVAKKVEKVAAEKAQAAADIEGDRVISAVKARAMKAAADAKAEEKVEPEAAPEPEPKVEEKPNEANAAFKLDVDGVFGPKSITALQHLLGVEA